MNNLVAIVLEDETTDLRLAHPTVDIHLYEPATTV